MASNDLKNMHIAVYALSLLGGAHKKLHTEHIAQKCLELAPDRFKWQHFNYPDKELVRKALFHASEEKNSALVSGRAGMEQRGKLRDGWQLTSAGAAWLREHESLFEQLATPMQSSIPKREAERFIKRIGSEQAFRTFAATGDISEMSQYAFTDLLNCSPDAPLETIRMKFHRIQSMAELVNDREILRFLGACQRKFESLLGSTHE